MYEGVIDRILRVSDVKVQSLLEENSTSCFAAHLHCCRLFGPGEMNEVGKLQIEEVVEEYLFTLCKDESL